MSDIPQEEQPGSQSRDEKIIVLTRFGKKMLRHLISFFLILFAATVLLFNWQVLTESPFSTEMNWHFPVSACRNIKGNQFVVDQAGERIIVLNPSGEIRSIIRPNPILKNAINFVWDICVDDKYIYILDLLPSPNGVQINGERILIYDFDGEYVDTVYEISHPEASQRHNILCDVNCNNGKVYVTKRENDTVSVCQVVDHELQQIRQLTFPGKEIFRARFTAGTRSTFVVTKDAHYYLDHLNKTEELALPEKGMHWNDLSLSPSGERYYLDSNRHNIVQVRPNAKKEEGLFYDTTKDEVKQLTDCYGLNFYLTDDVLMWTCVGNNQVVSYNIVTGEKKVLLGASRPSSFLFNRALVWCCALFLAGIIIWQLSRMIREIVQNFRNPHTREGEAGAVLVREVHTVWNIYGRNAFVLVFAFVAMTLVISIFYGKRMQDSMESSVRSKAADVSGLPGKVFGDYLKEINSARDYDSKAFKIVKDVSSSVCYSSEGAEFDFAFSIFRRLPDGKFMVATDTSELYCIGKIIEKGDPSQSILYDRLSAVEPGKPVVRDYIFRPGDSPYFVYSAIQDSDGQTAGVILVSSNRQKVFFETRRMIESLSMDLLMIFIIFVLLVGEAKLFLEFRKRRKVDPLNGKLLQTVCEGHRSCQFLISMSIYLDVAFLPTLFMELANKSGLEGSISVLAAVPLTLRNLMLVITLIFGSFLAKFNPGRYMRNAAFFSVFCFAFEIYAIMTGQYTWFLIGIGFMGITHGMKLNSLDAIGACGLQPDPVFKNIVFVNTEYMIGAAVGTSLGSLMCAKFGYTSVFVLGIVLEITLFCIVRMFIGQDINYSNLFPTPRDLHKNFRDKFSVFVKNIRHILRPELISQLFCAMVPIYILVQFDSYVLPVYNAWFGYPQQVTGFTGTVTKVLALIMIPYVFNKLASRGNRLPILTGLFLLAASLFFFAYDIRLHVLCLVLLLVTIFYIVFVTNADRLRQMVAERDNVKYNDIAGFFHGMEYLGATVAPLLMGYCLNYGIRTFALIFGGVTGLLLFVFLFTTSKLRRSAIGKM